MNKFIAITIGVLLLIVLVLFSMTYSVSFHEVAIKSQFGRTSDEHVITEPGLKFKMPIFSDVTTYDTRLQLLESPLEEKPTADGQSVVVRAFLMWKIDPGEASRFHDNYKTVEEARPFLQDQFREALSAISQYSFDELVGEQSQLAQAEQAVLAKLASLSTQGIEPVNVGISQFLLPSKATRAVLSRMEVGRNTLAKAERVKGDAQAEQIESNARTDGDKIKAFAEQVAADIRASANEQKQQYLEQMNSPDAQELAMFLVWLDALEMSLRNNTTLILEDNMAPYHLLNQNPPLSSKGIPLPEQRYFSNGSTTPAAATTSDASRQEPAVSTQMPVDPDPEQDTRADAGTAAQPDAQEDS